jgi:hypothetical protein
MAVTVIEFIDDADVLTDVSGNAAVVEVNVTPDSVNDVISSIEVVDVLRDGGSATNVLWGYGLPASAPEGTIWIDVS